MPDLVIGDCHFILIICVALLVQDVVVVMSAFFFYLSLYFSYGFQSTMFFMLLAGCQYPAIT